MVKNNTEIEEVDETELNPEPGDKFCSTDGCLNIDVGTHSVQIEDADESFIAVLEIADIRKITESLKKQGVSI